MTSQASIPYSTDRQDSELINFDSTAYEEVNGN